VYVGARAAGIARGDAALAAGAFMLRGRDIRKENGSAKLDAASSATACARLENIRASFALRIARALIFVSRQACLLRTSRFAAVSPLSRRGRRVCAVRRHCAYARKVYREEKANNNGEKPIAS